MKNFSCTASLFSLLLLVVLSSGCEEAGPERVPVSGKIFVDGEHLTFGTLQFVPENGRPVVSKVLTDGSFGLQEATQDSTGPADGVPVGSYRVAVSTMEVVDENAQEIIWHAPKKYADHRTSGLTINVTEPVDDLVIDLTWEGEQREDSEAEADAAAEDDTADAEGDSSDDAGEGEEPTDEESSAEEVNNAQDATE